jgi:hypothetical protein
MASSRRVDERRAVGSTVCAMTLRNPPMPFSRQTLFVAAAVIAVIVVSTAGVVAQEPLKGEAALKHPASQLAIKVAGLLQAGKIDEAVALKTKSDIDEWKKMSAADRRDMSANYKERAPDPRVYAAAIARTGELAINGSMARLQATLEDGARVMATSELEGGSWRAGLGPMVVGGGAPAATKEERVNGPAILKHPIGTLALQYVDLVHGGKMDEAMRLATAGTQVKWKAEPASERAESAAFRRKILPTRAELTSALQSGGVLIIEDDSRATLNVIRIEQKSSKAGESSSSSTTVAIPFAKENGQWRLAQ